MGEDILCERCGARNDEGAAWCNLCFTRFEEPSAPQRPAPPAAAPKPASPGAGMVVAEAPAAEDLDGPFVRGDDGVGWRCGSCGVQNAMALSLCASCGSSFADALRAERVKFGMAIQHMRTPTGFFDRVGRGLELIVVSWRALRIDVELCLVPLAGGLLIAALAAVAWWAGLGPEWWERPGAVGRWPAVWLGMFTLYLVGTWCQAAVVAAASIRFRGGDPTVSDGLRAATRRAPALAAWAAISATVGLLVAAIRERANGRLQRVAINVAETAWSIVTYFVIPVILFENLPARRAMRRSMQLFRKSWGETLTSGFGLGAAFAAILFVVMLVAGILIVASPIIGIVFAIASVSVLTILFSTLAGILNAALYEYAARGTVPPPYQPGDLGVRAPSR